MYMLIILCAALHMYVWVCISNIWAQLYMYTHVYAFKWKIQDALACQQRATFKSVTKSFGFALILLSGASSLH